MIPYMSLTEVAKELHISRKMASKARDGIRDHIPSRYPRAVVAWRKINLYAVIDYLSVMELYEAGITPKEPFNPSQVAWICGYEKSPAVQRTARQERK